MAFRVVILGGGLSGLCAAQTLVRYARVPVSITILEKQQRVGGWLHSTRFDDGTVFEHGPRSARSYGEQALKALNIISELGIDEKIVGITAKNTQTNRRYIYVDGELHELPSSLTSVLFRQPPFTRSLFTSLAKEVLVEKSTLQDESVYDFFQRRFNNEVAEYLSTSLCRGIFGGDARLLSVRSCFPILYHHEQKHKSVVRGMLLSNKEKLSEQSRLAYQAMKENWLAWTTVNGINTLPELWSQNLRKQGVEIICSNPCQEVSFYGWEKVRCRMQCGHLMANGVISTLSLPEFSSIVQDAPLTELLRSVNYVDMAVVTLEYKNEHFNQPGFGFLVPTNQECGVLGMTFDSCVLPHTSPKNNCIVTVMSGGEWFSNVFGSNCDHATVEKHAQLNVRQILGFTSSPTRVVCRILQKAIPQYYVGHEKRVDLINRHVNNLPLLLAGNWKDGAGVNDVIVNTRQETLRWMVQHHLY